MFSLYFKASFCAIMLICFVQKTTSVNPEIDNEGVRAKISDIVGAQQLALRSFLNEIKLDRQTFDHDIQASTEKTKKTFTEQVEKIIDNINADLKTVEQPTQPECASSVAAGIKKLSSEADAAHNKCVTESKPNIINLEKDTTKHADFQSKISQVPKGCVTTNDDSSTVIKCVEVAMDNLIKEINDSQNNINNKIAEIKQTVKNMETAVNNCQQNAINTIQDSANGIHEQFNTCMTATKE